MRAILGAALALALAALLGGCGGSKGPGKTPEATAQAMLAAVEAGDAKTLAGLYDYEAYARRENENWEEIPPGQRDLITGKLAEERAKVLQEALPALQPVLKGAQVEPAQVQGETATVRISGGQREITQTLIKRGGKWYVTGE